VGGGCVETALVNFTMVVIAEQRNSHYELITNGFECVWDDWFPCLVHDGRNHCGPEDGGDGDKEALFAMC